MKSYFRLFLFILLINNVFGQNQSLSSNLNITLYTGSEREIQAKQLLLDLESKYDLSKYLFTKNILIKHGDIPHSKPVLTLNTRLIDNEIGFLSVFLHEQIHCYLDIESNQIRLANFVSLVEEIYPIIPVGRDNGGARSKYSSYLHLVVLLLEYEALASFVGEYRAIKWFEEMYIHRELRKIVLSDFDHLKEIMSNQDLLINSNKTNQR